MVAMVEVDLNTSYNCPNDETNDQPMATCMQVVLSTQIKYGLYCDQTTQISHILNF